MRLKIIQGLRGGIPSVEDALAYPYRPQELAYLKQSASSNLDGDPQQVRQKLAGIAELYQTTDLSVVTICYEFAARIRSYKLVAEACGITG